MSKKENKNQYTDNIVTGLSSASGAILGSVGANAAENYIKNQQYTDDDEVLVLHHEENTDDVEVISHSHDDIHANAVEHPSPVPITTPYTNLTETPEPISIEDSEPNTIVDIVYAGPTPDHVTIDPNTDPILCVYGPPEPDILNDMCGDCDS